MRKTDSPWECEDKKTAPLFVVFFVVALIVCAALYLFYMAGNDIPEKPGNDVDAPKSGTVFYPFKYTDDYVSELRVETEGSGYYYLKLRNLNTNRDDVIFFIKGGESETVKVKLGEYEILYARGDKWYGVSDLFGENTEYFKANESFKFELDENGNIFGWTVKLYSDSNGKIDVDTIDADNF